MGRKRLSDRPVNVKQDLFAYEYAMNGGNACAAYRVAYGQGKYTDDELASEASLLRNSPKIAKRIEEYLQQRREQTKAVKEEAQEVLLDIMRATPADLLYADPNTKKQEFRSPQQLHKSTASAIKSMTNDNGKVSYVFESKLEAIKELAKFNGWETPTEVNMALRDDGQFNFLGFEKEEE